MTRARCAPAGRSSSGVDHRRQALVAELDVGLEVDLGRQHVLKSTKFTPLKTRAARSWPDRCSLRLSSQIPAGLSGRRL